MKVNLEEYQPLGNAVLLKLNPRTETEGGLFLPKAVQDRWMEVVKTGPMVTAVIVGDMALLGEAHNQMKLTFGKDSYLQIPEFAIAGKVKTEASVEMVQTFT